MSNIIKRDFRGSLYSFNMDGWFNATEAAKRFGKRLDHWLDNADTLDYIRALDEVIQGHESSISNTRKNGYLRTRRGQHGGGTWLHPKLAVAFARWLSAKFGVWCDLQIDDLIRAGISARGNANLLALLLRDEPAGWELRFGDSYYRALAKVTHTRYTGHAGGTPPLYGQITDRWVYGAILPADVHTELKARRSESEKMHQWLTDGGQERLDRQITLVTMMANSSADLKDFEARCMQTFGTPGQLLLIYPKAA